MSKNVDKPKVLLIGWDAADWKVIHPLMDKGVMPNLKALVNEGVMSEISTLHPVLSPMLWTSIATGKRPFKHGIHGFIEPTADGLHVQPISNLSRKTKAVWNILNQNDLRSIVVGWWPSHPAEPINGVMVSNRYHQSKGLTLEAPWPMPPGTVHPQSLAQELAELRIHPLEIEEDLLLPFIPLAHKVDQVKDKRIWMFVKTLAECLTIHGAATHLMETQDWDLMAVYYDAIDHFSHGFMKYHPPKQDHISDDDFEIFQHVVQCAYVYHDMMLGRLLELAGDDTTVILLSDHGFHPDHLRPRAIPSEPTGPAIEHRDFGIFAMKGPHVKKDCLIHGVNLLDIAPTVLQLFGLPVGDDFDGRVIAEAFVDSPDIESIPSWDDVAGKDGQHPKEMQLDAVESKEALQQLVELGYIEALDEDQEKNVARAITELEFNLARSYMDAYRYGDAVLLLHELYSQYPSQYRFGIQLAMCFKALNRTEDLDRLVSNLESQRLSDARKARAELDKYRKIGEQRRADKEKEKVGGAGNESLTQEDESIVNAPLSDPDADSTIPGADELFSEAERTKISQLVGLTRVNAYALKFLRGIARSAKGQVEEGLEELKQAASLNTNHPGLYIQLGDVLSRKKRWDEAEEAFVKALELDSRDAQALLGMARCYLGRRENREAVEYALQSLGQSFHNPMAHYCLGVAFHRMGNFQNAVDALELSLHQNPNNARAHGRLGYICKNELDDYPRARQHFKLAAECRDATRKIRDEANKLELKPFDETDDSAVQPFVLRKNGEANTSSKNMLPTISQTTSHDASKTPESDDKSQFITIVTGLPRTGTSMVMQMLHGGGMEVFSDGERIADEDNPKGYYELQDVKKMATNNTFMEQARGKVVKVVVQLLPYLPKKFDYRVIFMDRLLDEVLASQHAMLGRHAQTGADIDGRRLKSVFQRQLYSGVEVLKRNRIPTMRSIYSDFISDPRNAAERIKDFLQLELDIEKMVEMVDPNLYRQRADHVNKAKQVR